MGVDLKKRIFICLSLFLPALCSASAANTYILRIIAEQADVRLNPDHSSEIIAKVPKGALVEASAKEDEWFSVTLPRDESGFTHQGYIHEGVVEMIIIREDQPATPPPPPPKETIQQPVYYQQPAAYPFSPSPNLFSGFVTKFGWMYKPDAGGIGDTWVVGFNYDIGLHRNFALGIELLPSYRSYSDLEMHVIPILGFINLKAGLNLGDFIKPLGFIWPYAGAGGGLEAAYTIVSLDDETFTDFSTSGAYHIFIGIQLKFGTLKLIGEYQWIRVSDPNIDPNYWQHFLLFGFRFGK